MNLDLEKTIDEITNRLKNNGDISDWKKNRQTSSLVTLLSRLNSFPKKHVPYFEFSKVKNQILDRINVPVIQKERTIFGFLSTAQLLRVAIGAMASLVLVSGLTLGVAFAALNSNPGQAVYPLKKVVENIELQLTPQSKRTNLQLKFADSRVDELQQILQAQASGQISSVEAQKIVSSTVQDLRKNTKAVTVSGNKPSDSVANKLADISNQLRVASIQSAGQVKIDLQQAADDIDQTVPNDSTSDGTVSANGKITVLSNNVISIGTAKFVIDEDTQYIGTTRKELKIDQQVSIEGVVKDNDKTYAKTITLIADIKTDDNSSDNNNDNTTSTPPIPDTNTVNPEPPTAQ